MYYVFCIFECLRAPRKMGKCSLGLPSLNKDFINIIITTRDYATCIERAKNFNAQYQCCVNIEVAS